MFRAIFGGSEDAEDARAPPTERLTHHVDLGSFKQFVGIADVSLVFARPQPLSARSAIKEALSCVLQRGNGILGSEWATQW